MASPYTGTWFLSDIYHLTIDGLWPSKITPSLFGWITGGVETPGNSSSIERLVFATDTMTTTIRSHSSAGGFSTVASSNTIGYLAGEGITTEIDALIYATDTATAASRTNLSTPRSDLTAVSNGTNGWFGGGQISGTQTSIIDRITYATDTASAILRSDLSTIKSVLCSVSDGTNGWFAGGANIPATPAFLSIIERLTYATDTTNPITRSNLSRARDGLASVSNGTNGWFGAGNSISAPGTDNLIDRTTFATDTANAIARSTTSVGRWRLSAVTDGTNGWFIGGEIGGVTTNLIDRITFATDTANANARTTLTIGKANNGSTNNSANAGY